MLKVYCVHCKKHIYNTETTPVPWMLFYASDLTPANSSILQPQKEDKPECPFCGKVFFKSRGQVGNGIRILTDQGLLPETKQKETNHEDQKT